MNRRQYAGAKIEKLWLTDNSKANKRPADQNFIGQGIDYSPELTGYI